MSKRIDSAKRLTASEIRAGMSARFAPPEWAIMWEVGEGTGSNVGRYADAVMMSLWPSRGLELHGVEIKVSRSDWKREAMDPKKAEAVGRYCDRWWVHTPPGIIQDLSEVPPAWGVREFDGAKWRTLREADKREPEAVNRVFLAALLRRADETMRQMVREQADASRVAERDAAEKARGAIEEEVKRRVEQRVRRAEGREKNVAAFEAAFGVTVSDCGDAEGFARLGRMCAALRDAGLDNQWTGAVSLAERLQTMGSDLAKRLEALGIAKADA